MNLFRQTPPAQPNVSETSALLAPTSPTADSNVDEEYPAPNDPLEACRNQQQSQLDSTDPYKLWLEINSERHSAEEYVNNYLDALAKSYLFPDADVSEGDNPDSAPSENNSHSNALSAGNSDSALSLEGMYAYHNIFILLSPTNQSPQ